MRSGTRRHWVRRGKQIGEVISRGRRGGGGAPLVDSGGTSQKGKYKKGEKGQKRSSNTKWRKNPHQVPNATVVWTSGVGEERFANSEEQGTKKTG